MTFLSIERVDLIGFAICIEHINVILTWYVPSPRIVHGPSGLLLGITISLSPISNYHFRSSLDSKNIVQILREASGVDFLHPGGTRSHNSFKVLFDIFCAIMLFRTLILTAIVALAAASDTTDAPVTLSPVTPAPVTPEPTPAPTQAPTKPPTRLLASNTGMMKMGVKAKGMMYYRVTN